MEDEHWRNWTEAILKRFIQRNVDAEVDTGADPSDVLVRIVSLLDFKKSLEEMLKEYGLYSAAKFWLISNKTEKLQQIFDQVRSEVCAALDALCISKLRRSIGASSCASSCAPMVHKRKCGQIDTSGAAPSLTSASIAVTPSTSSICLCAAVSPAAASAPTAVFPSPYDTDRNASLPLFRITDITLRLLSFVDVVALIASQRVCKRLCQLLPKVDLQEHNLLFRVSRHELDDAGVAFPDDEPEIDTIDPQLYANLNRRFEKAMCRFHTNVGANIGTITFLSSWGRLPPIQYWNRALMHLHRARTIKILCGGAVKGGHLLSLAGFRHLRTLVVNCMDFGVSDYSTLALIPNLQDLTLWRDARRIEGLSRESRKESVFSSQGHQNPFELFAPSLKALSLINFAIHDSDFEQLFVCPLSTLKIVTECDLGFRALSTANVSELSRLPLGRSIESITVCECTCELVKTIDNNVRSATFPSLRKIILAPCETEQAGSNSEDILTAFGIDEAGHDETFISGTYEENNEDVASADDEGRSVSSPIDATGNDRGRDLDIVLFDSTSVSCTTDDDYWDSGDLNEDDDKDDDQDDDEDDDEDEEEDDDQDDEEDEDEEEDEDDTDDIFTDGVIEDVPVPMRTETREAQEGKKQ